MEFIKSFDLEMASQIATIVMTMASVCLAWIALSFSAKPKIVVTPLNLRTKYETGESATLTFLLQNFPRLYARPMATGVCAWVNLDPAFSPIRLRYGSNLEKEDRVVKKGKGGSKFLKADGIVLSVEEAGETVELTTIVPNTPGHYWIYLAIHTAEGGASNHRLAVVVQ